MKFKFQSFVDIQTSATSMQVIQWSVGGSDVVARCRHLFGAYKYFKLGKISVKMVPASTLPVDPTGLSYESDDPQTVDPRDQMNPGLVRITNGEDVFTNVSSLTSVQQNDMYNAMMLDPRWSKFMLQSGFRRTAVPLYWQIGQLHQDKWPGSTMNVPREDNLAALGTVSKHYYEDVTVDDGYRLRTNDSSSSRGFFQVGHRGKLGWLPTDYYQAIPTAQNARFFDVYGINNVPEVSVITCVLPKAYKTVYFYRVFITEEVYFSGLRSSPMLNSNGAQVTGIDQFLFGTPTPVSPGGGMIPPTVINNNGEYLP